MALLQRLWQIEERFAKEKDPILTDPQNAVEFVEKTAVDALAVAIDTSHGAHKFKNQSKLDLDRLRVISQKVSISLVLHGASSVPRPYFRKLLSTEQN